MEPLLTHSGVAAPLAQTNVNTDDIIPARFLKTTSRTGFAGALFANWRYLGDDRTPNPEFVLNRPEYQQSSILVCGENFGCGSSREHAPWALHEYGFRCVIAQSFGDIFHNNCFNAGILPIVLPAATVRTLLAAAGSGRQHWQVDLPTQTVATPGGDRFEFRIDPFRKESLLLGLDNVGWTLSHQQQISAYEERRAKEAPWLFPERFPTSTIPS
ncbi:MAG: 3-isopropylmalate dehydratase small subunit [Micromonosporaceae bacterium]|nr:3-isopropylmalate dehydratase small subunit [Micromonosporaceae bacterium]